MNVEVEMSLNKDPDRSTAYYYGDLERFKRKQCSEAKVKHEPPHTNEVFDPPPTREVPPLRDRETYSTAGTIRLPQKEKEPLLAELEVVGRLPLSDLESNVRRSRSWFCCESADEGETTSWRYSSLRTITNAPMPSEDILLANLNMQSPRLPEDSIRVERDALARALQSERARAAAAARAHDARLAELHGVIAELMRRRDADRSRGAILEELSASEDCESTTQPACDLDIDADRTDQNSSSALSPAELPTPQEPKVSFDKCNCQEDKDANVEISDSNNVEDASGQEKCERELRAKEATSCDRCCHISMAHRNRRTSSSCSREQGSLEEGTQHYVHSSGKCETRQAKLASRVCLKKTEDAFKSMHLTDENWPAHVAERLAMGVGAQADLREALLSASTDTSALSAALLAAEARVCRLEADNRLLECALSRAINTAQRVSLCCARQEQCTVGLCGALRAADRALEAYDVLLAMAESRHGDAEQRHAAELIAKRLLHRLDNESEKPNFEEPLLPPGPWAASLDTQCGDGAWDAVCEERLRAHAARLKVETVSLRDVQPQPKLFTYHDDEEEEPLPSAPVSDSPANMEVAVLMQEVAAGREERAHLVSLLCAEKARTQTLAKTIEQMDSNKKQRERHWLETSEANETEL